MSAARSYTEPEALPLVDRELTAKGAEVGSFRVLPSQALAISDSLPTLVGWVFCDIGEDGHAIGACEIKDERESLGEIKEARGIFDADTVEDAHTQVGTVLKPYDDDASTDGSYYYH